MDDFNQPKPTVSRRQSIASPPETQSCSESSQQSKVPKHLRVRYWTSCEEMHLVELWLRYKNEVTAFDKNLPVFRTIAEGMKEAGFHFNPQECRRKINYFKNRYIAERRVRERPEYMEEKKAQKAKRRDEDWPLYDLVHCVFYPSSKNADPWHETKIINEMLSNLPQNHLDAILCQSASNLQLNPFEQKGAAAQNSAQAAAAEDRLIVTKVEATDNPTDLSLNKPPPPPPDCKSTLDDLVKNTSPSTITPQVKPKRRYQRKASSMAKQTESNGVSYVLKHHFSKNRLDFMRMDNLRLIKERDQALSQLKAEKRELELLTSFLDKWEKESEQILKQQQTQLEKG